VRIVEDIDTERPWAILAVERPGDKPQFRATGARVIPLEDGGLGITAETQRRLGLTPSDRVWMAFG